jgi:hypothetical protein
MREEQTGVRDLAFSRWHRRTFGDDATAIDVDLVGYCDDCGAALYAIEATRREDKSTRVLTGLADRLGCDAFLVRYVEVDGVLVDLRAHYARPISGRRVFVGHEPEFVDLLLYLRTTHHCTPEATP